MRSHTVKHRPVPSALTANSAAAISITRTRPQRSASGPANQAPKAEPSKAQETAKPVSPLLTATSLRIAATAPLMPDESKPNKNPPSAETTEIRLALEVVC